MHLLSSLVIGCAAETAKEVFSKGDLRLILMKSGLDKFVPKASYSKQDLVADTVYEAKREASQPGAAARQGLQEFVKLVAERVAPTEPGVVRSGTPFWRLREALRADGFDLRADYDMAEGELIGVRLFPLDEPRAPLSAEITALEADFDRLGMHVAKNVYRQAVASLERVPSNIEWPFAAWGRLCR